MPNDVLKTIISHYEQAQIFLLQDEKAPLHLSPILSFIPNSHRMILVAQESEKTITTIEKIWSFLLSRHTTRNSLLICVGGGITTDLGGFAASTFKRGIPYLNIPTTLLAMVDASTGGKTGFNYEGFKNVIGTFSQPIDTLFYPELLQSLPPQELLSGYAELIKTALLDSPALFHQTIAGIESGMDNQELAILIQSALKVKKRIVLQDPNETGLRKALNFGHTIGHALEELSLRSSSTLPHGFAVMQGMVAELYLSCLILGMDHEPLKQLSHIMVTYYGKASCACKDYQVLFGFMRNDKKNLSCEQINFTLLRQIGDPQVNMTASDKDIHEALDYLFSL